MKLRSHMRCLPKKQDNSIQDIWQARPTSNTLPTMGTDIYGLHN